RGRAVGAPARPLLPDPQGRPAAARPRRLRRVDHVDPARPDERPLGGARGGVGPGLRPREGESPRGLDERGRAALRAGAPRARQPAARPWLPEHRLHAVHDRGRARRGAAGGTLARARKDGVRSPRAGVLRRPPPRGGRARGGQRLVSAELLPVFLKLAGRRAVLVGAGRVASAKLPALLAAGAEVSVVAPSISAA